jgi:hypothetical protein
VLAIHILFKWYGCETVLDTTKHPDPPRATAAGQIRVLVREIAALFGPPRTLPRRCRDGGLIGQSGSAC